MATPVYVCRKCKGSKELVAGLEARLADRYPEAEVAVELVKCQDICKGAVAGLAVDGQPVWFRRLRGPKAANAVAKLAARGGDGPIPKRLASHHAPRRDGRPPKR